MAAYAALLSLSQTTHPNRTQHKSLFSSDAEEKIRSIYEYVTYLLLFFENCPNKSSRWERRIRDVAFKIEDVIEGFVWHRIQLWHIVANPSTAKLEDELEDLKQEIGLIAGEVTEDRPANPPASSSRFASAGFNDAVIGLDDDVKKILARVCGGPPKLEVIPIVGMGGIGKTALARTVYNHASFCSYFDFRVWITVSRDYNLHSFRKILLGLIESMNLFEELVSRKRKDGSEVDLGELYEKLEKVDVSELEMKVFMGLKYRRYLVVIDDVWSTKVWDDFMRIFPDDRRGSKIMLTTRLSDIAAYPDCSSSVHEMQIMDGDQSWDLLRQKVFPNGDCPHELEDVGRKIAERCVGLPLAVVLVAGLLSAVNNAESTRVYWEDIAEDVSRVVGQELSEILSLSYTYLPHHLRPCFLYLGGFPGDESIDAATLIRLWVAEGFLKHQNECNKSLEEEAEEYLDDLVKRNLVTVISRRSDGRVKRCCLHEMVRKLCIRKGREEKFLRVIDKFFDSQEMMDERRISLRLSDIGSLLVPTTRTILSFNLDPFAMLIHLLGSLRSLRVLHDASAKRKEHSPQVFELFHLRYLSLNGSLRITPAIANLVNLETLIIHNPTFRQRQRKWRYYNKYVSRFLLPLEIWKLQKLRHLIFNNLYSLPRPPDGSTSYLPLLNLQTLSLIENLVWSEKVVQMIPNVRRLGLVYTTPEECHLHHLKDLLQLEKLHLIMSSKFSWRVSFPNTLKKLTMVGGRFLWAEMSIIGSLPNLQVLKLQDHACNGESWEASDEEFPQLRFLLIEASSLRHWMMQGSCFPILERLVLRSCQDLRKIPEDIGEIPTLELIEVEDCTKSVLDSAMEIKVCQMSCGNDSLQVRFVKPPKDFSSTYSDTLRAFRECQ